MTTEPKSKAWWQSLPVIMTSLAGIITASTGLVVALQQSGAFNLFAQASSEEAIAASDPTLIQAPLWGNLCMDVANEQGEAPPVVMWECHNRGNQRFVYDEAAQSISLPKWGNRCLSIDTSASGSYSGAPIVAAQNCTGESHQKFAIAPDGTIRASEFEGLCLDISGEYQPAVAGAPVIAWECHGGENQRWFIENLI